MFVLIGKPKSSMSREYYYCFMGAYERTLTVDGRFVLPHKLHEEFLKSKFPSSARIYCDEHDACLYLYPDESRPYVEDDRLQHPDLCHSATPLFYSIRIDERRRISIPKACRESIGLDDKIRICGNLYTIKIAKAGNLEYNDDFPEKTFYPLIVKTPL